MLAGDPSSGAVALDNCNAADLSQQWLCRNQTVFVTDGSKSFFLQVIAENFRATLRIVEENHLQSSATLANSSNVFSPGSLDLVATMGKFFNIFLALMLNSKMKRVNWKLDTEHIAYAF